MPKWNITKAHKLSKRTTKPIEMSNGSDRMKRIPTKKVTPKPPKFNIMWLWIAMILGFFALQYIFSDDQAKQITYQEFEEKMLQSGDVDRLVAYKQNDLVFVEVYIKKDRLTDSKYEEVRPNPNSMLLTPNAGPNYYFTDGSYDALERKLNAAQESLDPSDRVSLKLEDRTNAWTGWI